MMISAGVELGLDFVVLDPAPDACAGRCASLITADWASAPEQSELLACDRITCDFENVPATVLEALSDTVTVLPDPRAFEAGQDRLVEKSLFRSLDIPVPDFAPVSSRPELLAGIEQVGLPAVLKTRRLGYDGKGQAVLRSHEDLEPAWQELGGQALILEAWVPHDHECAITAVRSAAGEIRFYPLSWTVHDQGILRLARAPAPVDPALVDIARDHVATLMRHLDYVGCLTLELFAGDFGLLANE
ncbi:MAG: ATP-grasp domain-containing protein, partial [Wenzhouxiangella sp.]